MGENYRAKSRQSGDRHNADERPQRSRHDQTEVGYDCQTGSPADGDDLPPARLDKLDDYLEMMYEVSGKDDKAKEDSLNAQIRGTAMILKLCRDVMNLEQLIQNSTAMNLLTRVLQDEFKKSVELTFNILRIFLAFSNFLEMHSLMANYRIGVLTMKVIEFEVKRHEHREVERKEMEQKLDGELQTAKTTSQDAYQQAKEKAIRAKEKETRKVMRAQRKQDRVLFVSFYILLNLAEDVAVERKMLKRDLLEFIFVMLDRTSADLLILSFSFLKKISVFEENKDLLKENHVVQRLAKFIPCSSQPLVHLVLRLLFNLSFDSDIREQMVKDGLLPKLVTLLKTPSFRGRTLKLLYHLSVDDRCKSMFTYTEAIPMLLGMIVNFPQPLLARELAALMVNLSINPRNAKMLVTNRGMSHLMDRLINTKDPLLAKIIRNISQWTLNSQQELENPEAVYRNRGLWSPHIKTLLQLTNTDNQDLLIELLGTIANLTPIDLPSNQTWFQLLVKDTSNGKELKRSKDTSKDRNTNTGDKDHNILSLLSKMLVPGMAQNDILLEVIMVIAAFAIDASVCELFASSIKSHSIVQLLYQAWREKAEDSEIVLQSIHCFTRLFLQPGSRDEAMYDTRAVVDMMECLSHRNSAVRAAAEKGTEIVLELDRKPTGELGPLGIQIRKRRFQSYNAQYLDAISIDDQMHGEGNVGLDVSEYGTEDSIGNGSPGYPYSNGRGEYKMGGVDDDEEGLYHAYNMSPTEMLGPRPTVGRGISKAGNVEHSLHLLRDNDDDMQNSGEQYEYQDRTWEYKK